ncbi:MAG: Ig-like domain-containing protein [Candidatus Marinimicrobia bacterium]|nr:Ig-like domain-containing protein [Candidatus Neomarinimicrobiota bacterium]
MSLVPPTYRRFVALLTTLGSLLMLGCAAVKGPSGGPVDDTGPVVVRLQPPNLSRRIDPRVSIEIYFDELVDPLSIPGSLIFTPQVDFTTKVRGRRVIVRPAQPLAGNQTYVLTLQRGIRDYRRNRLSRSQQYVFSTGGEIPTGRIEGLVLESDPKATIVVGLFVPSDSTVGYDLFQSVDLADDGRFSFSYLDSGRYRLAVVEGGLADFPAGINRRRYALSSEESLTVQGDTVQVRMLLSSPLTQPQIQSLEWATPTYLAITFDTPFGEAPPPAGLYATQNAATWGYVVLSPDSDSTVVDLGEGYTQLGEPYRIEPFVLPGPTMEDTLQPRVIVKGNLVRLEPVAVAGSRLITTARGLVTFSEPVRLPEGLMARVMGRDTLQVPLLQDTPLSASLEVYEPERYKRAQFLGGDITDYAGNPLADSLVSVKLVFQLPQSTGEISGRIIGLAGTIVVEVREAETGRRVAHAVTDTAGYHIDLVPPGFYHLFAHGQVGRSPLPYYSGSWEPYRPAAPFASYPDPVEVRPRWEVGGVDINFNVALDTTQEVPADRKD